MKGVVLAIDEVEVDHAVQALYDAGWIGLWCDYERRQLADAGIATREHDDIAYAPAWAHELYAYLLPDDPPMFDPDLDLDFNADLSPLSDTGRALADGRLSSEAVEGAHRLGGPEAVVALVRGLA